MTEIAEFIEARLAERAADAHLVHALGCDAVSPCADGCCPMGTCGCGEPERILVDIEAKLAILAYLRHVEEIRLDNNLWTLNDPAAALRALAAEFAGHPKFKPKWRIDA